MQLCYLSICLLKRGVFVGDLSSIRENVAIAEDSIIGRNVMVENNTTIGKRVTIQTGCYITADMEIEDEVFLVHAARHLMTNIWEWATLYFKVQL